MFSQRLAGQVMSIWCVYDRFREFPMPKDEQNHQNDNHKRRQSSADLHGKSPFSRLFRGSLCRVATIAATPKTKTDVANRPGAFDHVGLLVNEPPPHRGPALCPVSRLLHWQSRNPPPTRLSYHWNRIHLRRKGNRAVFLFLGRKQVGRRDRQGVHSTWRPTPEPAC